MSGKALLEGALRKYASRPLKPASLEDLITHAKSAGQAYVSQTTREEILARISHNASRLREFPHSQPIRNLIQIHESTFETLLSSDEAVSKISGKDPHSNDEFDRILSGVRDRHKTNLETLMEAKKVIVVRDATEKRRIQGLIDDFLLLNTGWQLLSGHLLSATRQVGGEGGGDRTGTRGNQDPSVVGMVAKRCELVEVVSEAVDQTTTITERYMDNVPDVIIEGDQGTAACCVPSHIHHILFEVLKNAFRATVLAHGDSISTLPPIKVRLVQGSEEVCVVIQDRACGMSRAMVNKAFDYLYTSAEPAEDLVTLQRSYQPVGDPMTGMGVGLPVSRLYARHFGGDLRLFSIQGDGTTACLYIPRDITIREQLPRLPWEGSLMGGETFLA